MKIRVKGVKIKIVRLGRRQLYTTPAIPVARYDEQRSVIEVRKTQQRVEDV